MLTRAVAFLLLAVPVTGRSQGPPEGDGALPKEAARFAGKWVIRSIESDGRTIDDPAIRDWVRLDIQGDRFEFLLSNLVARTEERPPPRSAWSRAFY